MVVLSPLLAQTLFEALKALGPTNVIILLVIFLAYQLYSPEFLPETKFQTIINEFENEVNSIKNNVGEQLDRFEEKQLAHIQITRAIASVENPSEEINEDVVDDYLIQNGINKTDFLLGEKGDGNSHVDHLSDDEADQLMDELRDRNDNSE